MRDHQTILGSIVRQVENLLELLGSNTDATDTTTKFMHNKTISEALDIAGKIVDAYEKKFKSSPHMREQFPNFNTHIMTARIELHALQDEAYLLEIKTLWNENAHQQLQLAQLEKKLSAVEADNQRLKEQLAETNGNNAELALLLRRQQQLKLNLRQGVTDLKRMLDQDRKPDQNTRPTFRCNS